MVSVGLDNYSQIDPVGSNKGMIHAVDLQYSRFLGEKTYLYYALGVGYKGLPIYNQVIWGIGSRFELSRRVNLYAQVGFGSGGYTPSLIDTGSGLLVYPKVSAEYMVTDRTGVAVTAGYLIAPMGRRKTSLLVWHLIPTLGQLQKVKALIRGTRANTAAIVSAPQMRLKLARRFVV